MGAGIVPKIRTLIHWMPRANDLWSSRTTRNVEESAGIVQRKVMNMLQNARTINSHKYEHLLLQVVLIASYWTTSPVLSVVRFIAGVCIQLQSVYI